MSSKMNWDRKWWLLALLAVVLHVENSLLASDLSLHSKVPLLTFEQASSNWTEINSEYKLRSKGEAQFESKILSANNNRFLQLLCSETSDDTDRVSLEVSLSSRLDDKKLATLELQKLVQGVSFRVATKSQQSVPLAITFHDVNHDLVQAETHVVNGEEYQEIRLPIDLSRIKSIRIELKHSTTFMLDDFNFLISDNDFARINFDEDKDILTWLNRCSRRYFLEGYQETESNKAVVFETSRTEDIVTISGMGFALAAHVLADMDKELPEHVAKSRIKCLLNWIAELDCKSGLHGWHGFPNHYLRADHKPHRSKVSTVDWAICAVAIRVVRSYYHDDSKIVLQCDQILDRVDWAKAVDSVNLLVMGFEARNGEKDPYRWGLAFSEETELVCLEAIASGKVAGHVLNYQRKESKNGHVPSWFGAGFTYNWLQLWSGPLEGFQENSRTAYQRDLLTCEREFGLPIMGLTACMTLSSINTNGYAKWNRYISHQGSDSHGAALDSEVIQISPAPYGAALALPFAYEDAIKALQAHARLVDPHPILGLPDSIRIKELPDGVAPIPNWEQVDINIGPMMLAIEQVGKNRIGALYQQDLQIESALPKLIGSFNSN